MSHIFKLHSKLILTSDISNTQHMKDICDKFSNLLFLGAWVDGIGRKVLEVVWA